MAKGKDFPGFETLGEDIKAVRQALGLSRRALAERVNTAPGILRIFGDGRPYRPALAGVQRHEARRRQNIHLSFKKAFVYPDYSLNR